MKMRFYIDPESGELHIQPHPVPDPAPDSVFVITGYDLGPKAKRALQSRRRRKS